MQNNNTVDSFSRTQDDTVKLNFIVDVPEKIGSGSVADFYRKPPEDDFLLWAEVVEQANEFILDQMQVSAPESNVTLDQLADAYCARHVPAEDSRLLTRYTGDEVDTAFRLAVLKCAHQALPDRSIGPRWAPLQAALA